MQKLLRAFSSLCSPFLLPLPFSLSNYLKTPRLLKVYRFMKNLHLRRRVRKLLVLIKLKWDYIIDRGNVYPLVAFLYFELHH
jgi:hypothetical protein